MTLRGTTSAGRAAAWILTVLVVAVAALFASPGVRPAVAACGVTDPTSCLSSSSVVDCLDPPTPAMPDTGVSRFFLTAPPAAPNDGKFHATSRYDDFGYAGLKYHTYDLGCGPDGAVAPDALVNTSVANMMFSVATFMVGLTNSVREHAYDPKSMWGWTDDLVATASAALYQRIFTVLGVLSVVIVGAWLMWSARRGDMSGAATTAGWAILVMVITTAIAAWPLRAATIADTTLTGSIGVVNSALHPKKDEACGSARCVDDRTAQRQASGVISEVVLYRQWLSGELGSPDSETADKYGERLYAASSFTWDEAEEIRKTPSRRDEIVKRKNQEWKDTAAEVKKSDPDAYEYLTGKQGTDRIGSAFTALVSAIVIVPFDLVSSLLIILAFLIIRLAVVFLPAIATIGIMRPASGPLRGLFRTVVAAILNCVIFGIGASVYLLALDFITGTESLAGWQQILLIFLTGLVMWMLLRPFRRLTSLAGGNPFQDMVGGIGAIRRRAFDGAREAALVAAGAVVGTKVAEEEGAVSRSREERRPESWTREDPVVRVADAPPEPTRVTRVSEDSPVGAGFDRGTSPPASSSPGRQPQRVSAGTSRPETTGGGLDYRDPSHTVSTRGEVLPVQADERFVIYRPDRGFETVEPDIRPESRSTAASRDEVATVGSRPE